MKKFLLISVVLLVCGSVRGEDSWVFTVNGKPYTVPKQHNGNHIPEDVARKSVEGLSGGSFSTILQDQVVLSTPPTITVLPQLNTMTPAPTPVVSVPRVVSLSVVPSYYPQTSPEVCAVVNGKRT